MRYSQKKKKGCVDSDRQKYSREMEYLARSLHIRERHRDEDSVSVWKGSEQKRPIILSGMNRGAVMLSERDKSPEPAYQALEAARSSPHRRENSHVSAR